MDNNNNFINPSLAGTKMPADLNEKVDASNNYLSQILEIAKEINNELTDIGKGLKEVQESIKGNSIKTVEEPVAESSIPKISLEVPETPAISEMPIVQPEPTPVVEEPVSSVLPELTIEPTEDSGVISMDDLLKTDSNQMPEVPNVSVPEVAEPINETPSLENDIELPEIKPDVMIQPNVSSEVTAAPVAPVIPEVAPVVAAEPVAPVIPEVAPAVTTEPVAPVVPEVAPVVAAEPVAPVIPEVAPVVAAEPVAPVIPEVAPVVTAEPVAPVVPEVAPAVTAEPVAPVVPEVPMNNGVEEIKDFYPTEAISEDSLQRSFATPNGFNERFSDGMNNSVNAKTLENTLKNVA